MRYFFFFFRWIYSILLMLVFFSQVQFTVLGSHFSFFWDEKFPLVFGNIPYGVALLGMPNFFSFMLILSCRVRWRHFFSPFGMRNLPDIDISCPMTSFFFPSSGNLLYDSVVFFSLRIFLEIYRVKLTLFSLCWDMPCLISIDRVDSRGPKAWPFSRITCARFIAYSWEFSETCIHVHVPLPIHENSMRTATCYEGFCVRPYSQFMRIEWGLCEVLWRFLGISFTQKNGGA